MNRLNSQKQIQVISMLCEGSAIRSTERVLGVHRDTIMRLAVRVGQNCQRLHDQHMQGFHSKFIQCDEIWSFVGKEQGRLTDDEKENPTIGDQYTFVGIDAETKLVPAFHVGKRDGPNTMKFVEILHTRLNGNGRLQLTTDGWTAYQDAVSWYFGREIDFAQQVKTYAAQPAGDGRYSPPEVSGVVSTVICGHPNWKNISTSYVERQNLTMRMHMRRLTRLTNAFSKKLENLKAAVALHFAYYNFVRIHKTLHVTPAMEAGIADFIWDVADLLPDRG